MKRLLIFLLVVVFFVSGGGFYYRYITSPADSDNKSKYKFIIRKNEPIISIAKRLEAEGLIRNRLGFLIAVKQMNIENKIQAGSFELYPSEDVFSLAKRLTKGTDDVWITVIEGLRREEIADIFAQEIGLSREEFLEQTKGKEGYLFPDTYLFPKQSSVELVVNTMLRTFDQKVSRDIRRSIEEKGLSFEQGLILASLVEREAKFPKDKVMVASVLLKRLKNDWPLQVDAAVQYAIGYDPVEKTYWKKNLTKKDLQIDSPYNTYQNTGLPPSPIANPGLESIKAVAEADENTPYWFYLSDNTGKTYFSKTLQEHNEKIKKYLKK